MAENEQKPEGPKPEGQKPEGQSLEGQSPAAEEANTPAVAAAVAKPEEEGKGKRWHKGRYRDSRRHQKAGELVDQAKHYDIAEAFELLKSLPAAKFDETVECAVRLGIDPKKTDQLVRGAISLPHGIGKEMRVICFAEGDKAKEAEEAGAAEVGSADLAKKVADGWLDFDVAIASPDMMKHVGKLGRVLGPQGKMPSPKAGTVTPDVATAVREFKAGKVEFRTDAGANVHAPIGKRSFSVEQLADNATAFVEHLRGLRPAQAKGAFVTKVVVAATMSPGIRISVIDGGAHA
ncbi:MAG: 50S ribosomal protein L1 [Planctomycetes bacterium]|nr:50S ribosomal protein L1 [Planctomycetota bacterium]